MVQNAEVKKPFWQHEYFKIGYDAAMALLAIVIIACLFYQAKHELTEYELYIVKQVDLTIWLIFVADYFMRLFLAENKAVFFRRNIIDLLSILPLDVAFQGLRLFRAVNAIRALKIFYLFRVIVYLIRAYKRLGGILGTNHFHHIILFTFFTIFFGAIAISFIEDMRFGDALWWSFVTTTTVGYGDIAPSSLGGRLVAVFLMLIGIGFLGMFTGTIATYFISKHAEAPSYRDETLTRIIARLEDFRALSIEDIDDIYAILIALKKRQTGQNIEKEAAD